MKKILYKKRDYRQGQVIMEFTFCMIIAVLLMLAVIISFRWSSVDYANRRIAHDELLVTPVNDHWSAPSEGPLKQLNPEFFNADTNLELVR